MSVDGYIANSQGGIGLPVPEEALHRRFNAAQERTALNLYGRRMYAIMSYWDSPPADSPEHELEYGRAWRATPKVVRRPSPVVAWATPAGNRSTSANGTMANQTSCRTTGSGGSPKS